MYFGGLAIIIMQFDYIYNALTCYDGSRDVLKMVGMVDDTHYDAPW